MAYERPITIREAITHISERKYVLPAIQREFVWKPEQITYLFDSLMRGYPVGTFLFWEVPKSETQNFQFYDFITNYHAKNNYHNEKSGNLGDKDIIALLDGQQRLTALYISLVGTYAYKTPYKNEYLKRELYLNLLNIPENDEVDYDFRFLTAEESKVQDVNHYWFRCKDIIHLQSGYQVSEYLENNSLIHNSEIEKEKSKFAHETLERFYSVINKGEVINFYLEKSTELDKVLQIFIRVNSGGTKLSYSDLLLSIATAQWKEKDARELIHDFVDEINNVGNGFNFNKDLVLKSALVLSDLDVKFKVNNFNKENMKIIEQQWEKISGSIMTAVQLVSSFGYDGKKLAANNAIIPIAYFIHNKSIDNKIIISNSWKESRQSIKEWLIRVLLKGIFGGTPDAIYPQMRKFIKESKKQFPLAETINHYKGTNNSISFSEEEIDNLLNNKYGNRNTHTILLMIYPSLNNQFEYDQDHIHPISKFKKSIYHEMSLTQEDIDNFESKKNNLANLQLLEKTINRGDKKDLPFEEWLKKTYCESSEYNNFLRLNHIDKKDSLDFKKFTDFTQKREEKIKTIIMNFLRKT